MATGTPLIVTLRCERIDAPYIYDAPINGRSFAARGEQVLVPLLAPATSLPSTIPAPTRASSCVNSTAKSEPGCSSCGPSTALNASAQVFAKLKHLLRDAAEQRSTLAGTTSTLLPQPSRLPPPESRKFGIGPVTAAENHLLGRSLLIPAVTLERLSVCPVQGRERRSGGSPCLVSGSRSAMDRSPFDCLSRR